MAAANEEYKAKLRQRNMSQGGPEADSGKSSEDSDILESEIVNKEGKSLEVIEEEGNNSSQKRSKGEVVIPVVEMSDFEVVDMDDKLNLLMSAINKINTSFHLKFETLTKQIVGDLQSKVENLETNYQELLARVDDAESTALAVPVHTTKIEQLENKVEKLCDDIAMLKGLVQVQDAMVRENKSKIVDLTARSMSNNVVITGLTGDSEHEKDAKEKVLTFYREKMDMETDESEVEVAHRIGKLGVKPRMMVVRCVYKLRERIFNFTKNLKREDE